MQFSLFFFAADSSAHGLDKYRMLLDAARYADERGFAAIWTPERHFNAFGGLYPSPAITSAAVAAVTRRIQVRAGSVVLPLNNPLRVAEEWSMVDNLSNGRVSISFASGWHVNDFVLAPANYAHRRELLFRQIDVVRALWRGESVLLRNGAGREIPVSIKPLPVQAELPVWLTAQSDATFLAGGERGYNILTNLNEISPVELQRKIGIYREALEARHGRRGHVTLMAHTFVGTDAASVRAMVEPSLRTFLQSNMRLHHQGSQGWGHAGADVLSEADQEYLVSRAVERFIAEAAFIGDREACRTRAEELRTLGVDELACLIDFGLGADEVMAGLEHLDEIRAALAGPPSDEVVSM
jgi:natural product biosynthesis luciferase-like monooxygenase protein